jgi:hypothetical protein
MRLHSSNPESGDSVCVPHSFHDLRYVRTILQIARFLFFILIAVLSTMVHHRSPAPEPSWLKRCGVPQTKFALTFDQQFLKVTQLLRAKKLGIRFIERSIFDEFSDDWGSIRGIFGVLGCRVSA